MAKYDKSLPQDLKEAYVAALEDPDMMALKEELALLRTVLSKRIESLQEDIDSNDIRDITTLVDKISKTQATMVDYEYKSRQVIPITMFPVIIRTFRHLLSLEIPDERVVERIGQRIGEIPLLMAEPKKVKVETE